MIKVGTGTLSPFPIPREDASFTLTLIFFLRVRKFVLFCRQILFVCFSFLGYYDLIISLWVLLRFLYYYLSVFCIIWRICNTYSKKLTSNFVLLIFQYIYHHNSQLFERFLAYLIENLEDIIKLAVPANVVFGHINYFSLML